MLCVFYTVWELIGRWVVSGNFYYPFGGTVGSVCGSVVLRGGCGVEVVCCVVVTTHMLQLWLLVCGEAVGMLLCTLSV